MNRRIAILVGISSTIFLGLFIYAIYFVIDTKGYLEDKFQIHLKTNEAEYFSEGMQLYYNGLSIGAIDEIRLEDSGDVILTLLLKESNRRWIKEDAEFYLDKPLIGTPKIKVSRGKSSFEIGSNVVRMITVKDGINDIVSQLDPVTQRLNNILLNVDTLIESFINKDDNMQKILRNLNRTTDKFASDDPLLNTIIGDEESVNDIKLTIKNLRGTLEEAKATVKNINENTVGKANRSVDEINQILINVSHKLDQLDSTFGAVDKIAPELSGMQKDISATINKTDDLIEKVDGYIDGYDNDEVVLP
jgi:ABC-type transporter Mla subunit MlaD